MNGPQLPEGRKGVKAALVQRQRPGATKTSERVKRKPVLPWDGLAPDARSRATAAQGACALAAFASTAATSISISAYSLAATSIERPPGTLRVRISVK